MKQYYYKILLFWIPLNILVLSSYAYNKNKPYITLYTSTSTSRMLSECDIETSIYDNDEDMKSVKENFDRQTSQRFEEYEQRMKEKRQKRKEQRDKNVQEIIEKDRKDKSLAEKVEKGCLMCGCGLGGVAAGVGIIGPVAVKGLENAAMLVAAQKGIEAGMEAAIQGVKKIYYLGEVESVNFGEVVTATNFSDQNLLGQALQTLANDICGEGGAGCDKSFCLLADGKNAARFAEGIAQQARAVAIKAGDAAKTAEKVGISLANTESSSSYLAIGYSVLAILIILLIMIIIYLILRYRRKKKMQKKLQYTKLLNK
ncbi:surface antigen [Plasmodium falciparum UGT5.1]|uniref:Surface antigen n=1 Tax=Plasmodium falciparum UGT5.1 TaxID=1237627 RepID=W7JCH5_PLAFA|nr:surface antigen [Plasmodium falciparum UGT5.1]